MTYNYSVLMAVYKNDNFQHLKEAIESIQNQTIKTNDFIVVIDGPIPKIIENYLIGIKDKNDYIKLIFLETNLGLGIALSKGILNCKNNLVMRMDSDDVSLTNRAENLLMIFNSKPELSVIGSFIEEFNENTTYNVIKNVPVKHKDIFYFSKFRNPMNHPSVMFKRDAVIDSGNYIEYKLNEDYYLWVRMLLDGKKFYNTPLTLLKMRVNQKTFSRRGGISYFKVQNKIYQFMLKKRHINLIEYLIGYFVRFFFRVLLPPYFRGLIYSMFLRKNIL